MAADSSVFGTAIVTLGLDKSQYEQGLKGAESQSNAMVNNLTQKFKQLAVMAATAFSVHAIYAYTKEATMLTARLETMTIVLGIIGKNAGYSSGQMKDFVQQVKVMGITTEAAQSSLTKMAQANLDLNKAAGLARVAQDAAVIGNTDSSAAFERMVFGIKTAQTEVLRTIGINVSFESSYASFARTLNKTAGALSESEKMEARLNAVMAEGLKIQGAYEAAMATTGKQINSLPRLFTEVKEKWGELFSPALGVAVRALMDGLKGIGHTLGELSKSGDLVVWAKSLADALTIVIKGIQDFGGVVISIAKGIWEFKTAILALVVALGSFMILNAVISSVAALATGLAAANTFIYALTIGFTLAEAAELAFGITTVAVNQAITRTNIALAAAAGIIAIVTYAYLKWKGAAQSTMDAVEAAVNKSDEEMTRFHAKMGQMKFGVVDADPIKEYNKQLKTLESSGVTLNDKAKDALKKRVNEYYVGSKMLKELTEEEKEKQAIVKKTNDLNKDAIGLRLNNIAAMRKEIIAAQDKAVLEDTEAKATKLSLAAAEKQKTKDQNENALRSANNAADLALLEGKYKKEEEMAKVSSDRILLQESEANKLYLAQMKTHNESERDILRTSFMQSFEEAENEAQAKIDLAWQELKNREIIDKKIAANKAASGIEGKYDPKKDEEVAMQKRNDALNAAIVSANEAKNSKILSAETALKTGVMGLDEKKLGATTTYYNTVDQHSQASYDHQRILWEKEAKEYENLQVKGFDRKKFLDEKEAQRDRNTASERVALRKSYAEKVLDPNSGEYKAATEAFIQSELDKQMAEANRLGLTLSRGALETQMRQAELVKRMDAEAAFYKGIIGYEDEALEAAKDATKEKTKLALIGVTDQKKIDAIKKKELQDINKLEADSSIQKIENIRASVGANADAFEKLSQMYSEDSNERKRIHEIAMAFSRAEAVLSAVVAVAKAAQAPPPWGFASMAAMAAAMVGLLGSVGVAFSGGGGGSPAISAAYGQNTTVFGGANNQGSESIGNTWKLLEDTYDLQKRTLTGIYENMKQLNANITGIVKGIIQSGIGGPGVIEQKNMMALQHSAIMGVGLLPAMITMGIDKIFGTGLTESIGKFVQDLPLIGNTLGKISSALFGGDTSVTGTGLRIGTGETSVRGYTSTHTSGGWLGRDSDDISWGAYNAELANLFNGPNGIYPNLKKGMIELAGLLGGDTQKAMQKEFADQMIDLTGLDSAGVQKKLSETISGIGDVFAKEVFGSLISQYQKVGEGALETVSRLAVDLELVKGIIEMTGAKMYEWAEFFKAAWGFDPANKTDVLIDTAEALIELAGGIDKLMEASSGYYDNFTSDSQKQIDRQKLLTATMADFGRGLPATRDAYMALVGAQDIYNEDQQKLYWTLIKNQDVFDEYYNALGDTINKTDELTESLKNMSQTIDDWLVDLSASDLAPTHSAAAIEKQYKSNLALASGTNATEKDVSNFLSSATNYLTFQKTYGTEGSYLGVYNQVIEDVAALKTGKDLALEVAQKQLDVLNVIATNTASTATNTTPTPSTGGVGWMQYMNDISNGVATPNVNAPRYTVAEADSYLSSVGNVNNNFRIRPNGGSSDSNGGEIIVQNHIYLDGREIQNSVAKGMTTNNDLIQSTRRAVN